MKQLMTEYHKSHLNRTNQLIHYVCVPLIFWSISAALWTLKLPLVINAAIVMTSLLMLYYLLKSIKVFATMLLFTLACLAINYGLESMGLPLLWIAVVVFVLAWIGQFIGHHIEGKKPSFFQDLQFLLIGPAWVVFKFFNIRL
ncbi:Mpo1 family 2-hydroxy fatty acid dioxygenase [Marinicella sediminis]|nr:Mpo1-like protein [Marinicella sediminis]